MSVHIQRGNPARSEAGYASRGVFGIDKAMDKFLRPVCARRGAHRANGQLAQFQTIKRRPTLYLGFARPQNQTKQTEYHSA